MTTTSVVKLLIYKIKDENLRSEIKSTLDKYQIGPGKYYEFNDTRL
jgi:hypothetical protein